jgi:cytochrome c-type biogenesis protein CcmH
MDLYQRKEPGKMRKKWMIGLAALAAVLGLGMALATTYRAAAQSPSPTPIITDNQVNAVARQLYCPVCENIPLDVCPTTACAQWRELIRQMLGQGKSVEFIKNYFVVNYGTRVLATPPRTGLNWLIYILPPVGVLVGVYLVYRVLRTARKRVITTSVPPGTAASEDKYIAQIEEELRHRQ